MPTYTFFNKKTNKEEERFCTIAEMESYLKKNPDWDVRPAAPLIGDPVRQGIKKPDGKFRERLQEIQKKHPKGSVNPW